MPPQWIDLSHAIENGLAGPGGHAAAVRSLTGAAGGPEGVSAEVSEATLPSVIGTRLNAPRTCYDEGADLAALPIESLILPGILLDARDCDRHRPLTAADLPADFDPRGRAVLVRFGWDRHWGGSGYDTGYPVLAADTVERLIAGRTGLLGVDAAAVDPAEATDRPVLSALLGHGIHVVEGLTNLGTLIDRRFRLFAVPLAVRGAAGLPVRAFAEML